MFLFLPTNHNKLTDRILVCSTRVFFVVVVTRPDNDDAAAIMNVRRPPRTRFVLMVCNRTERIIVIFLLVGFSLVLD